MKIPTKRLDDNEWDTFPFTLEDKYPYLGNEPSDCMHDNCPQCHGTGKRDDGLGPCIHMISCPCRRCSPICY